MALLILQLVTVTCSLKQRTYPILLLILLQLDSKGVGRIEGFNHVIDHAHVIMFMVASSLSGYTIYIMQQARNKSRAQCAQTGKYNLMTMSSKPQGR